MDGDWFLYVGNLCVKKEKTADMLGGDHDLYMLWYGSAEINAGKTRGYLDRAEEIYFQHWHSQALFPLALNNLENFISSNSEPSRELAKAYYIQAEIYKELGNTKRAKKASQNFENLKKQGYYKSPLYLIHIE